MAVKTNKKQRQEISSGVEKLTHEYERSGRIKTDRATYKPRSKEAAIKQALAIEYGKHHVGQAGSKKK